MDTLDGFILNVFRTSKPILNHENFDDENVWVCDLLNQDLDLANEYIKHKLTTCKTKIDKLEFLYASRSCYKGTIQSLENELDPTYNSGYTYYRDQLSESEMRVRLARYKQAFEMTDQAICYYIDCSKLDCGEASKTFQVSSKKGAKVDVIRILNALYELKLIELKSGQVPSKELFMQRAGEFLGIDLSKYEVDLSQALNNASLEANLKVFEEMKSITQNKHYIVK